MITDLVIAIISVNSWTPEQSYAIKDSLEREGLFDVDRILSMKEGEIFQALERAGYTKSAFVKGLIEERLFDMAKKLSNGGMEKLSTLIAEGPEEDLKSYLLSIKGVGPVVMETFLMLNKSE